MSARARTLAEAAAVALLVLVGTALQRGSEGIQSPWLAFLALLAGPAFRRLLVLRGRASPAPAWTFALEVLGFGAALAQPVAAWGLVLEGAAALGAAWPGASRPSSGSPSSESLSSQASPAATPLERLAPWVLLGLALAASLVRDPGRARPWAAPFEGGLALVAAFALAPGASASAAACARRVAVLALFLAEALLLGYEEKSALLLVETATRALAFLGAGTELLALARERGPLVPAPERTRRTLARALHASALALLALHVLGPLVGSAGVHRSLAAGLGFAAVLGLLLLAWNRGALDLLRPSTPRERVLGPVLLALALAAALPARWDRIWIAGDTDGYARHSYLRPPLYPCLFDVCDARPGEPPGTEGFRPPARSIPDQRYLGVVHVQKVLAVVAIAVLVFALAGALDVRLVLALAWFALSADVAHESDAGAAFNVEALLSEGLNHSLVLLALAAAFAYLRRPRWSVGLALAALLALLVLCRPANAPLVTLLGAVWLRHARTEGLALATRRALVLGLVAAVPVLGACAKTARETGYFRLHAFTGLGVFCTTFSLATPEDVDAFPEPELHELVRRCVLEEGHRRISTDSTDYVNVNLHEIGLPVLHDMRVLPEGPTRDFVQDDMLAAVGKRFVRRHPAEFARLVLRQVGWALSWSVDLPLALAFGAGALLWWRRRRGTDLFAAGLALLPVVAILPSCVFMVPLERYRAPLAFVELVGAPLVLALLCAREADPRTGEAA